MQEKTKQDINKLYDLICASKAEYLKQLTLQKQIKDYQKYINSLNTNQPIEKLKEEKLPNVVYSKNNPNIKQYYEYIINATSFLELECLFYQEEFKKNINLIILELIKEVQSALEMYYSTLDVTFQKEILEYINLLKTKKNWLLELRNQEETKKGGYKYERTNK